jgi:hypothetical protein
VCLPEAATTTGATWAARSRNKSLLPFLAKTFPLDAKRKGHYVCHLSLGTSNRL